MTVAAPDRPAAPSVGDALVDEPTHKPLMKPHTSRNRPFLFAHTAIVAS